MKSLVLFAAVGIASCTNVAAAASPAGGWRGSWSSATTGHRGPVRARIRPVDHDTYRAFFVGRFAGVIPFAYSAKLDRVPGTWNAYSSTRTLPLMGTYRMTATVTGSSFDARYQSRNRRGSGDFGAFHLRRTR